MSCRDLGLDGTKPNVELIRDIFIYYNIFKFQVPRLIIFGVIMLTDTHTHTHTHTHTQTDRHTTTSTLYEYYEYSNEQKPAWTR